MNGTDGSRTKLDARTWVPIGLLTGILAAAVAGTASAVVFFKDINAKQEELVKSSKETSESVKDAQGAIRDLSDDFYRFRIDQASALQDPWHGQDMKFWTLSAQQAVDRWLGAVQQQFNAAGFKAQLPTLELPPVQTVGRDSDSPRK